MLKDGYVFAPGLLSLIELARRAKTQAEACNQKTDALLAAMHSADQTVKTRVEASRYAKAIRNGRQAIRKRNVPAAGHPALNWFP